MYTQAAWFVGCVCLFEHLNSSNSNCLPITGQQLHWQIQVASQGHDGFVKQASELLKLLRLPLLCVYYKIHIHPGHSTQQTAMMLLMSYCWCDVRGMRVGALAVKSDCLLTERGGRQMTILTVVSHGIVTPCNLQSSHASIAAVQQHNFTFSNHWPFCR